ncbi:MAG: hypothetical protein HC927_07745 [Deltaproteobacteria bacterium]|nr:hypothetical protein [Deltaproteobacteria bacterium]
MSDSTSARTLGLDPSAGGMPMPRLFFALLRQRFTGTMTLEQTGAAPGRRTVWFRGGLPVFTDWFSEPDLLGSGQIHSAAARAFIARWVSTTAFLTSLDCAGGRVDAGPSAVRISCSRVATVCLTSRSRTVW